MWELTTDITSYRFTAGRYTKRWHTLNLCDFEVNLNCKYFFIWVYCSADWFKFYPIVIHFKPILYYEDLSQMSGSCRTLTHEMCAIHLLNMFHSCTYDCTTRPINNVLSKARNAFHINSMFFQFIEHVFPRLSLSIAINIMRKFLKEFFRVFHARLQNNQLKSGPL